MEKADRPEQPLERVALKPQQPRPAASACLAAKPRNMGPEEQRSEVVAYLKAPSAFPPMPEGVRLVRWEPMAAPVRLDVCSVVFDVPKFIESELRALDSRLNNPWTIHGGFTVAQMLDRLAQAGVEAELEPKGGASTTKRPNTESGHEIK
jgi:hypothetical protein